MSGSSLEQARFNMVQQQVRPWEVLDQRVLNLIGDLPREAFVPEEYRGLAYSDIEVPLGGGQCMMFPRMEARLLQALDIRPDDRILEIGTGSGYLSACLARLGSRVLSLDINPAFIEMASERLAEQKITNVEMLQLDGLTEEIPGAPFDVIAVTGSLPLMPDSLKQQMATGGRMFIVTGEAPVMEANLVTRVSEGVWRTEGLFETELVPLENSQKITHFSF